ncbi:MAG: alpha/beta hydrolase-fold protein [Bryobacteraceae bacterium]|jgi:S-formylglutathione hydrolase FrmB
MKLFAGLLITTAGIAGISMGAAVALQVGLGNLDKFSYFGSFSGTVLGTLDVKTSYGEC